jgi:hypothetical protein
MHWASMAVFDQIERVELGPRPYAQPDFNYLNGSARQGVQAIRHTIEEWFLHYPNDDRAELRTRLRSEDNYQHRSAFFELFLHELLLRLGCDVEVHPQVAGTQRHPDFHVQSPMGHACYLEAILASDETREESAANARMNQVYDALNRLNSPDFYIGMNLGGAPATPPSARHIRTFLSRHLAQLNFDDIADLFRDGGFRALPHWQYQHDGWSIELFPLPKSDQNRGRGGIRPIGIQFEPMRLLQTREAIRDSVLEKAGRYGELGQPYVIAVNVLSAHLDRIDVMEALFGFEQFRYRPGALPQQPELGRAPNGAWFGPAGIQNTRVSAALVFPNLSQSSLCWTIPCIYHNPWAAHRYAGELDRLNGGVPRDAQYMDFQDGESLRSIFDLREDWPGQ